MHNRSLLVPIFWLLTNLAFSRPYQTPRPSSPSERVYLHLSEDVVAAGKTLWWQGSLFGDRPVSKVLYVEILNAQQPVLRGIYPIENGLAQGQLKLPDTLSGGWYQVRAYTQWIRNWGEAAFASQPLLVVNPSGPLPDVAATSSAPASTSATPEETVRIELNKTTYRPREPLTALLRLNGSVDSVQVSVSVRQVSPLAAFRHPPRAPSLSGSPSDKVEVVRYPPEDESLLVSGRVSGIPEGTIDRMAVLSIPGQRPYFDYDFVDREGIFRIPVKAWVQGEHAVVLQANDTSLRTQWTLDEKFAPENTYATLSKPDVPDAVLRTVQQAYARRAQVQEQYQLLRPADSATVPPPIGLQFYGAPNYVIRPDDYTALPNMKEVSRELLLGVQLREGKHSYRWRMIDLEAREYLKGEPAILLDGVLVRNVPYVVGLAPGDIDRIETVNRRTYYGEYRLNGTVAIYTQAGDAYAAALSASAWHQPMPLYSPYQPYVAPDSLAAYEPDFRTLLHWQPAVAIGQEPYELRWRNADQLGEFEIVVKGVTPDGQPLYGRTTYTVSFLEVATE